MVRLIRGLIERSLIFCFGESGFRVQAGAAWVPVLASYSPHHHAGGSWLRPTLPQLVSMLVFCAGNQTFGGVSLGVRECDG